MTGLLCESFLSLCTRRHASQDCTWCFYHLWAAHPEGSQHPLPKPLLPSAPGTAPGFCFSFYFLSWNVVDLQLVGDTRLGLHICLLYIRAAVPTYINQSCIAKQSCLETCQPRSQENGGPASPSWSLEFNCIVCPDKPLSLARGSVFVPITLN